MLFGCGRDQGGREKPGDGESASGGSGGSDGTGGSGGTLDQAIMPSFEPRGESVDCSLDVELELSPNMPTVARVQFDVSDLSGPVRGAMVEYQSSDSSPLQAPVDLSGERLEATVWGLVPSTSYSYRVAVNSDSEHCYGPWETFESGVLRAGVQPLNEVNLFEGALEDGFIVAAQSANVIVFNKRGDVVWGYSLAQAERFAPSCAAGGGLAIIFSAKLSYDVRYLLAHDLGPFDCGDGGTFYRIPLDGSELEVIELPGGDHHDFTVTPQGIAYIAKLERGEFDQLMVANHDGSDARVLVDLAPIVEAFPKGGGPGQERSHFNAVHYWRDRDIYTVSNRESDAIAVISGDGEILRGIGKEAAADFETILAQGTGNAETALWRVQHGHDLYADDKLLVFSNGDFVGGVSRVLHYTLTADAAAVLDWSYDAMGSSATQGDVQMLPNGNVLITSSNRGLIHEIDGEQSPVATYLIKNGFGYVSYLPSLYGTPADGR